MAQERARQRIERSRRRATDANQARGGVMTPRAGWWPWPATRGTYDRAVWNGGRLPEAVQQDVRQDPRADLIITGQTRPVRARAHFKVLHRPRGWPTGYLLLYGLTAAPERSAIAGHTSDITDGSEPGRYVSKRSSVCDTLYYDLGYDMYLKGQTTRPTTNGRRTPGAEDCRARNWPGLRQENRRGLPEESTGTIPPPSVADYLWKDKTPTPGHDWCKNGREYGSYVQQSEWQIGSGWQWEPGPGGHRRHGQG